MSEPGARKKPCSLRSLVLSLTYAFGEFGSRPGEARSAGVFRRLRVALLFGHFLLGKQEKVTRRRAASGIKAVKASPEAIPITLWIPAFAGMTEGMHRRRRYSTALTPTPLPQGEGN